MSRVTGLDRNTINRGLRELRGHDRLAPGRIRHAGHCGTARSRPPSRGVKDLGRLLHDATAGDPITGLLWTHRSMRKLAKALRRRGIKVSPNTIARLLHDAGFSLRTNRKQLAKVT